jgi:hypothetical protein
MRLLIKNFTDESIPAGIAQATAGTEKPFTEIQQGNAEVVS